MNLKSIAQDAINEALDAGVDLQKHDARFHPNGYKIGDKCALRENNGFGQGINVPSSGKAANNTQSPANPKADPGGDKADDLRWTKPSGKTDSWKFNPNFGSEAAKKYSWDPKKDDRMYHDPKQMGVIRNTTGNGKIGSNHNFENKKIVDTSKYEFGESDNPKEKSNPGIDIKRDRAARNKRLREYLSDNKKPIEFSPSGVNWNGRKPLSTPKYPFHPSN